MTFFYDIYLSRPHRPQHSNLASGSTISDEFDTETVALMQKLALDDLADILPADSSPLDKEIVQKLQVKQYNEWLSIAEDAKLANGNGDTLMTDAAYFDSLSLLKERPRRT
jgi:hypothetical protein